VGVLLLLATPTGSIPMELWLMDVKLVVLPSPMGRARLVILLLPVDVMQLRAMSASLMSIMMRPMGAKLVALLPTVFVPRVRVLLQMGVH
jgi:hypothetical protein